VSDREPQRYDHVSSVGDRLTLGCPENQLRTGKPRRAIRSRYRSWFAQSEKNGAPTTTAARRAASACSRPVSAASVAPRPKQTIARSTGEITGARVRGRIGPESPRPIEAPESRLTDAQVFGNSRRRRSRIYRLSLSGGAPPCAPATRSGGRRERGPSCVQRRSFNIVVLLLTGRRRPIPVPRHVP